MLNRLREIRERATKELDEGIDDLDELELWHINYLGRKGILNQMMRGLKMLSLEERRTVGSAANELKALLERSFAQRKEALKETELNRLAEQRSTDVTLPGRPAPLGRLHPTTQMLRQICDIFTSMGFEVIEGPEVEWDYYNFQALNMPQEHPARDMWATLWIDYETEEGERPMLLRTHTSPLQIRIMEQRQPPLRVVMPGKVYRYEATDATHESMFYQIEGLAVDEDINFPQLKGTLYEFAHRLFGPQRRVRFRCDYFPFVEPGVEMAIDCLSCGGKGCRLCSNTGWIEILGAGMVHPEILKQVNYDPERYSGFAFGLGLERIPMLKYGIDDIRLFYSNDLRFLSQF